MPPCHRFHTQPLSVTSFLDFAVDTQARQRHRPKRVRYPTDCEFTSSCSPPQVALTQLLSVAGGKLHQKGTFTLLVHVSSQAHCGTSFRVRWRWGAFHPGRCPWAKLLWPFRPLIRHSSFGRMGYGPLPFVCRPFVCHPFVCQRFVCLFRFGIITGRKSDYSRIA